MMTNSCRVCGGKTAKHTIPALLACPECGFVTADMKIPEKKLKELYSGGYFKGGEYADYQAEEKVIKLNFRRRLKTLARFIADPGKKSLYEIGCAYGFFLEEAGKIFRSAEGIDLSADAVKAAKKRGLQVQSGDFLKTRLRGKKDVFCMWDTIEHLENPFDYVKKIAKHTRRGGLLAITTGDIGSLNARLRGPKWRQIHPPTHLHYFSKQSLTRLLEKNGYRVVYAGHPGQFLDMDNALKILFVIRSRKKNIYEALKKISLNKIKIYLNLFDLLYIIARKD